MLNLTIIRHAPTEYNKKEIFMGSLDIEPLPVDTNIATKLKQEVINTEFTSVYSSPLKRAAYTASLLTDSYKINFDSRLRERSLGKWEGMSKNDVRLEYNSAFKNDILNFYELPPDGEAYEDVILRVSEFIIDLSTKENNAIIVTHNGVFRVIKSLITGEELSKVFNMFEPFLTPQKFSLDSDLISLIKNNPFYTVDK